MKAGRVVAVAFLFGSLFPIGAAPAACAAEGPTAALVVDTGSGDALRYCVVLPDGSVTGLEVIKLASEQHGLQYRLGYGGNVVCQLAGVGYESDECLKEGPEFWGYWRGNGSGGWEWSSSGAGSTTVRDGDVEGWAWGTGNDGSSHPAPPEATFESVCGEQTSGGGGSKTDDDRKRERHGARRDRKSAGRGGAERTRDNDPSGRKSDERGETSDEDKKKKDKNKKKKAGKHGRSGPKIPLETLPTPTPSVAPSLEAHPASSGRPGGGPPRGGLVAVGAAVACLAGGVFLQRRRTRTR